VRAANTWQALDSLRGAGLLAEDEHAALRAGYDFLLRVQSRLRIVHNRALDEAPGDPAEVEKLSRRLGFEAGAGETTGRRFLAELERHTRRTRELFVRLLERERAAC
jgi:glutamate-ammonia-ligase adenylyltransferase